MLHTYSLSQREKELLAALTLSTGSQLDLGISRHLDTLRNKGALLLKNLPESFPKTQFLNLAQLFGKVTTYTKEGGTIMEIKVQQNKNQSPSRPSFKNNREFYLHTDLSYIPNPPHMLIVHCLKNSPNKGGQVTLCDTKYVLRQLSQKTKKTLRNTEYLFPFPTHYKTNSSECNFAILTDKQKIRFRRDGLKTKSKTAALAVQEFIDLAEGQHFSISMTKNSLLLIDNQRYLHGRFAYSNHATRHLNRIYLNHYRQ